MEGPAGPVSEEAWHACACGLHYMHACLMTPKKAAKRLLPWPFPYDIPWSSLPRAPGSQDPPRRTGVGAPQVHAVTRRSCSQAKWRSEAASCSRTATSPACTQVALATKDVACSWGSSGFQEGAGA